MKLIILLMTVNWVINLMTFIYINSQSGENSESNRLWNVSYFDISEVRSNSMVKTSVCCTATGSAKGTHILKMEFIISL